MLNFKNEINFIYTVDDAFLPLVGVSVSSILENIRDKKINFFIATEKDDKTDNYLRLINFSANLQSCGFLD